MGNKMFACYNMNMTLMGPCTCYNALFAIAVNIYEGPCRALLLAERWAPVDEMHDELKMLK